MLVDEHQRRDQLTLCVEQVHLRGGRNHVRKQMAHPRRELIDELDQPLAVATHVLTAGVNRTRSSPSLMVAPPVSRFDRTRGKEISRL